MRIFRFNKTGHEWYVDLPEFLEAGGSAGDLQMVEGADTMLDVIAGVKDKVSLMMSTHSFEGADRLVLTEKCDPQIGGGYYFMPYYNGRAINQRMWLCYVTEFVFGEIPAEIFIRKENE